MVELFENSRQGIDLRKVTLFVILLCSLISIGIEYLPDGKAFSVTSVAVSSDGEKLVSVISIILSKVGVF
jgi:hypothetical protein